MTKNITTNEDPLEYVIEGPLRSMSVQRSNLPPAELAKLENARNELMAIANVSANPFDMLK